MKPINHHPPLSRAQISRAEISKLYVSMRHLFQRGYYKPLGASGSALRESLAVLKPEIYGDLNDHSKVELNGLVYVIDRLPKGIEQCRYIKLISEEGFDQSGFERLIPAARRRNSYRVDPEEMLIEVTRGRSEIYDILTHLTFLYLEGEKILNRSTDEKGNPLREWFKLEEIVLQKMDEEWQPDEPAFTYLSMLLGRTFQETQWIYKRLAKNKTKNSGLFSVIYWLGKLALEERNKKKDRRISFTPILQERIGHHLYGERWANSLKEKLYNEGLIDRNIHIISSNLHSVLNTLYAEKALQNETKGDTFVELMENLSQDSSGTLNNKVKKYAGKFGFYPIEEHHGTNIQAQIIDLKRWCESSKTSEGSEDVLVVFDYAFGEQAFEVMDELLKPLALKDRSVQLLVKSVNIIGKAGILEGDRGDIMLPTAHIFEGTTDNYPLENDLIDSAVDWEDIPVKIGPMITVLGTSLQNKDILSYFANSSWKAVGLEMEGAHYQKAIQAAHKIRKTTSTDLRVRYAYYASDNPLDTGATLSAGSLGLAGVKPTYIITKRILEQIFED